MAKFEELILEFPCLWDSYEMSYTDRTIKKKCKHQLLQLFNSVSRYPLTLTDIDRKIQTYAKKVRRLKSSSSKPESYRADIIRRLRNLSLSQCSLACPLIDTILTLAETGQLDTPPAYKVVSPLLAPQPLDTQSDLPSGFSDQETSPAYKDIEPNMKVDENLLHEEIDIDIEEIKLELDSDSDTGETETAAHFSYLVHPTSVIMHAGDVTTAAACKHKAESSEPQNKKLLEIDAGSIKRGAGDGTLQVFTHKGARRVDAGGGSELPAPDRVQAAGSKPKIYFISEKIKIEE